MSGPCGVVRLAGVDDARLDELVRAATADAAPDDVTPPLTAGPGWTPERVAWLRDYHRARRDGLDGPARESSWAVLRDGRVVGAVRLARTADPDVLETGIWLARAARRGGVGTVALRLAVARARQLGAHTVTASTTPSNPASQAVLRRLGFVLTTVDDEVRAVLALTPS